MRSMIRAVTFIVIFGLSVFDPMRLSGQEAPAGKLPPGVTPTHYQLELEIEPEKERFSGEVRIDVVLDKAQDSIWLHGEGMEAEEVYVLVPGGDRVRATYIEAGKEGVARLDAAQPVGPGRATLVIRYSRPFGQSLKGLYQVKRNGKASVYTHFQPLSARKAFPGFDEPRFKTPFDIAVTVSGDNTAVSNAPERATFKLKDGRRRIAFSTSKPIPTYLVALAVGEFDVVEWQPLAPNKVRARPVPLRGIAPRGQGHRMRFALENTEAMVAILEDYFGLPYPYAKLDLVTPASFNSGGMENVGAIFYRGDRILLDERPSIFQLRGFAYLHAHELAHSWFGNLVTPVWWDDLWLNEAFATWMSVRVVHTWRADTFDDRGPVRAGEWAKWSDRLVSARKIRQPIATNHDVVSAFDSITYSKGASVLSMLERYMGEDAFRGGVRRFMHRHKHGVATADDFFTTLASASDDEGVNRAFRSFLDQPGTPLVAASWFCRDGGGADLLLKQSRSLPRGSKGDAARTWTIPLCLAYPDNGARRRQCVLVDKPVTTVDLKSSGCPAWVLPNEEGAAYVNFSLPDEGWAALIKDIGLLSAKEKIALTGSINAAYEAGLVGTGRLIEVARHMARSELWDVVRAPMQPLRNVKLYLTTDATRPTALKMMRDIYQSALERFDLSDAALQKAEANPQLAQLRGELFWFLAIDAEHRDLSARLGRLATAYLGVGAGDQVDKRALHASLVRIALIVAIRDQGLPLAKTALGHLKTSGNAILREHLVRALGHQTDPKVVARILQAVLDQEVSKRDASQLIRRLGRRAANAGLLFDWIRARYDVLSERIPRSHMAWLPWRVSGLCDKAGRDRVEQFFCPPQHRAPWRTAGAGQCAGGDRIVHRDCRSSKG